MKLTIILFAVLSLSMFGAVSAQQTKHSKKKTPAAAKDKTTYEADAEMLEDLRKKVSVIESKRDWEKFDRQSSVVNRTKTRTAYRTWFPIEAGAENLMEVIVVHDSGSDKFYEIRGIEDFPWRPFSDFKWISNDVLQFDQWIDPNNGERYQVNLKTGKIVAAGYVRSR